MIGLGALKTPTDDATLFGTDKEKTLFIPREDSWKDLAEQCAEEGVGVSMFLGNSRPIDIASIGKLSSDLGGSSREEMSFLRRRRGFNDRRRALLPSPV